MGFWSRLRNTISPDRRTAEIDEEIQFHLEMRARERNDPRHARLRFGNPATVREETRAMSVFGWLESLWQDARYGLRQLSRTRVLTAAILASLAIGIGVNTTIFSVADAALLRSLPVKDPASLRIVQWTTEMGWPEKLAHAHQGSTSGDPRGRLQGSSFGPRLYRALAKEQTAVESLIGFSDVGDAAVSVGGRLAERVHGQFVSANFFQELGVPLLLGRPFAENDDRLGQSPVVILSHRFWQREFGGRADVLGETVSINSRPAEVIGVAPAGFFGVQVGQWSDLYAPLASRITLRPQGSEAAAPGEDDQHWWVRLMARLQPGADAFAAGQQLTVLYQRMAPPAGVEVDPSRIPVLIVESGRRGVDALGGSEARPLWILLLLAGLVLLIVCANVANLLLSRAVTRRRESSVRLALGASRLRLLRQQLVESTLLAVIGGALGLLLLVALSSQSALLAIDAIGDVDVRLDPRVLIYTAGISLLTALLFGLAPALRAAGADWNEGLKSQARSVLAGRLRLPRLLVVLQLGLCITVLVAAGLLGRTLANLKSVDIGFDRDNLLYASVNPWRSGYKAEQVGLYIDRLRRELSAQPGVRGVAAIGARPLAGGFSSTSANFPGRPPVNDGSNETRINLVSDGLFETLGVSLLAGRALEAYDMRPGADAAVVNELFVSRFLSHQNPLGQRFGIGSDDSNSEYQIVGVVANSLHEGLRQEVQPTIYRPLVPAGSTGDLTNLVIRATLDSEQVAQIVRGVAASIDPTVPIVEIRSQNALIDRMLRAERLLSRLSTAFGAAALALASVGLGGLLAYAVARRRNEIGVRMALGASPRDVVNMVLGDSLRLVAIGALIGLPGAYAIGRLLERTLYGLEPADPLTALAALAILATVAALAAWLPASRAARIDPITALRDD